MADNSGVSEEEMKVFLDDTEEQLQILDATLLKLEKDPENQELLQIIFRAAHTIKGGAATLGHEKMTEITHHMESIFDAVRKGQLGVTPDLVDAVFECLDVLNEMKDDITNNQESDVDVTGLVARLEAFSKAVTKKKKPKKKAKKKNVSMEVSDYFTVNDDFKELINKNKTDDNQVCMIYSSFTKECEMKAVRAFQLVNEVISIGEILISNPSVDDIYSEKVEDEIATIVASSKDISDIEKIVKTIDELDQVSVTVVEFKEEVKPEVVPAAPAVSDIKAKPKEGSVSKVGRTVRVDVERLDSLMNLVGELVIDRTRIYQLGIKMSQKYEDDELTSEMQESSAHIGRITAELQEEIMKARMLPIGNVFSKFPRMVRDTAKKCNKKVNFVVEGQATELDRSVIEEIGDPLIHILRNAVDHGIEDKEGRKASSKPVDGFVKLSAFHEENHIVIRVEDDGKGIDVDKLKQKAIDKGIVTQDRASHMTDKEALNLVFISGMSTAAKLSDISGRGVGMDIVRANIEKINGQVSIESELGKGSVFTIKLPLTLAIIQALLIRSCEQVYAIPLISVQETIQIHSDEIQRIKNKEAIILRGHVLPILRLKEIFYPEKKIDDETKLFVVVVSIGDKQVGFVVDSLVGEQEIVIKNLSKYIGDIKGISGATILGDGKVALIIDVASLINKVILDNIE